MFIASLTKLSTNLGDPRVDHASRLQGSSHDNNDIHIV